MSRKDVRRGSAASLRHTLWIPQEASRGIEKSEESEVVESFGEEIC